MFSPTADDSDDLFSRYFVSHPIYLILPTSIILQTLLYLFYLFLMRNTVLDVLWFMSAANKDYMFPVSDVSTGQIKCWRLATSTYYTANKKIFLYISALQEMFMIRRRCVKNTVKNRRKLYSSSASTKPRSSDM